jgi:hypothetical protein
MTDAEYVRLRMAIAAMEAGVERGGSVIVAFDPRAHARVLELLNRMHRVETVRRDGEGITD